jgi:hypothetical protein
VATPKRTFGGYVKAAFTIPWNLLAIGAGTVLAFLTGHPDIALPLVAAGEVAYLATTAGHSRFQNYVDNYLDKKTGTVDGQKRFADLYMGLDVDRRELFDRLRMRCLQLGELGSAGATEAIQEEQLAGVNKLLWVYLKLLHTKMRLEKFFASTDERDIDRTLKATQASLAAIPKDTTDPMQQKKKTSLEDTLATLEARKKNVARARDNQDFVNLELERIAAKLSGVVELAANRQDPGALTSEVDDAARSVQSTEQMIGELQMFTGLAAEEGDAPKILTVAQRTAAQGRVRAGG